MTNVLVILTVIDILNFFRVAPAAEYKGWGCAATILCTGASSVRGDTVCSDPDENIM